jgi:hypothetical protein
MSFVPALRDGRCDGIPKFEHAKRSEYRPTTRVTCRRKRAKLAVAGQVHAIVRRHQSCGITPALWCNATLGI